MAEIQFFALGVLVASFVISTAAYFMYRRCERITSSHTEEVD